MSNIFLSPFQNRLGQLRRRTEIANEGPAQSDKHSTVLADYDKLVADLIQLVADAQETISEMDLRFDEERVHHRRLGLAFDEMHAAKLRAEEQLESLRDGIEHLEERLDHAEDEFDVALAKVEQQVDAVKDAADKLVDTTTGGPFRPNNAPASPPVPASTSPARFCVNNLCPDLARHIEGDRAWCEAHTPWSGHYEHCNSDCPGFPRVQTRKATTLDDLNPPLHTVEPYASMFRRLAFLATNGGSTTRNEDNFIDLTTEMAQWIWTRIAPVQPNGVPFSASAFLCTCPKGTFDVTGYHVANCPCWRRVTYADLGVERS